MKTLILGAALCAALPACAQTVTVTAANLTDGGAAANGTIVFQPTLSGRKTSYQQPGGGIATVTAVKAAVVNGAFTLTLPDALLTIPAGICFAVSLSTANGASVLGPGYTCVQPTANNAWCLDGQCNFDTYTPNLASVAPYTVQPPWINGPGAGQLFLSASQGYLEDANGNPVAGYVGWQGPDATENNGGWIWTMPANNDPGYLYNDGTPDAPRTSWRMPAMTWSFDALTPSDSPDTPPTQAASSRTAGAAMKVLALECFAATAAATCTSVYATLSLVDDTSGAQVAHCTFADGENQVTGLVDSTIVPAGDIVTPRWTSAGTGCSTNAAGIDAVVQYQ